ncbi:uncharacterized protein BJX67DRAFT_367381 [Aspergillus lucknowensis]|uniref:Uncharacterized protein n=1 Tax=Aspergillus lucknowensis TaxID=176173 RepID=A0ABR4L957_9EURO
MADDTPLTRAMVLSLLGFPFYMEEDAHPWGSVFSAKPNLPLLRTWDGFSGSQPSETGRMLARSPRERLDTLKARKTFLSIHPNYRIWEPTPFISFTQSPQQLQDIANEREERRNRFQTITVINSNVRMQKGLPMLNMEFEMGHYRVPNPYHQANDYYKDHYICLWEVTEEEFVGNWDWRSLVGSDRWYEQIILPAFRAHNEKHDTRGEAFKMTALRDALLETQASSTPFSKDFCACSETEEDGAFVGDESDSSDEAEESNAIDNELKFLEES